MIEAKALVAWGVALTFRWLAPATPAEATLREAIVTDVVDVALDPWEEPLPGVPPCVPQNCGIAPLAARAWTVAQVLAIMRYEGEFRVSVDEGAKRSTTGAVCEMQVMVPRGTRILLTTDAYLLPTRGQAGYAEGWSADDLVPGSVPGRRERCIRAGLHVARESFRICRSLSLYTHGDCRPDPAARHRELLAREGFRRYPPPVEASN